MKIGMMADIYKPHISGVTNYITLNKEYLEKQGHEVYIFTFGDLDYQDTESRVIRSPGIPVVDTGFHFGLVLSRKARQLLYGMDIVHVHHPFQSGPLALRYCIPRNIPIVFTNHTRYDLYAQVYLPVLLDSLSESVIRAYLPTFCRACDMVVAPSASLKEILQGFGVQTPVDVIPNGVNLAPFTFPKNIIDRSTMGIPSDAIVLIYTGRLGPEKNLSFLLRAFLGLATAVDNVHIIFVGEGSERKSLQDWANSTAYSNRIHFTGFVPYEELPGYLKMADIFVTASVTEVHPLSVIEALGAGLPVLGIDAPGIKDTVVPDYCGLLSAEDQAAFTAKLMLLVTDHDLRMRLASGARQTAEKYDIHLTSKIMAEHYQKLVDVALTRKQGLAARVGRFLDKWR
jgi:glycosyltransferase involved in cell wall biosynthesis